MSEMSRTNTAKATLSSVLRGRGNELSVKGETKFHVRAFFNMAYWRDEDYRETMVALIKEKFEIVQWTVHGGYNGVQVELVILDKLAVGSDEAESRMAEPVARVISFTPGEFDLLIENAGKVTGKRNDDPMAKIMELLETVEMRSD